MNPKLSPTLTWSVASLCAAWLAGLVCAVHVSTWRAPQAMMVFGADRVWRGATAGFRAVVRDSASGTPSRRTRLVVWLETAQEQGPPLRVSAEDAAAWTMPVPNFAGAQVWLAIQAQPDITPAPPIIKIPLQLVDQPTAKPAVSTPLARHAPMVTTHAPGAEVAWVPTGGLFAVGLANPAIGIVQRGSQPWRRCRVRCDALHLDTHTDDDGLFAFVYTPALHPEPIRCVLGDGAVPTWVDLLPRAQVTQFQILVPTRCFAQTESLPVHVDSLPLKSPLAVDLWLEDLLVGTTALSVQERHADIRLGIQAALPAGFLTVVAFRHVLAPGAPYAVTRPLGTSAANPVAALAARSPQDPWLQSLQSRPQPPSELLAALALARVPAAHQQTPLLYDDTRAVLEAFEHQRDASHQRIYRVMGGLMGISLATIAVALWQMRRRLRRDVDAALIDADDEGTDPAAARKMTQIANRVYLILAVLALVLACYGLLAVVTHLRWG